MKISRLWIENYKSFKSRTKINIEKDQTTIIGMNESGKSSLIDLLGSLTFPNWTDAKEFLKFNRDLGEGSTVVEIEYEYTTEEMGFLGISNPKSILCYRLVNNSPIIEIAYGISDYFSHDMTLKKSVETIKEIIERNSPPNRDNSTVYANLSVLLNANNRIIHNYGDYVDRIRAEVKLSEDNTDAVEFEQELNNLKGFFHKAYSLVPIFYKHNEVRLQTAHALNDRFFADKTINTQMEVIIKATGLEDTVYKRSVDEMNREIRQDAIDAINRSLNQLAEEFSNYYKQDSIDFVCATIGQDFHLFAKAGSVNFNISERSQGLQWYVNLFLNLKARHMTGNPIIFLLDEPGVYLHINAQKQLLDYLDKLSTDCQIILTTHSPFMINPNKTSKIRVLSKSDGESRITNSLANYNHRSTRLDAIAPIKHAIGMEASIGIGLESNKLILVCEGESDKIYLDTMYRKILGESVQIIQCTGGSNSPIISFFLWTLEYKFVSIFDADDEGQRARAELLDKLRDYGDEEFKLKFIKEHIISLDEIVTDMEKPTIEALISEKDIDNFELDFNSEGGKVVQANKFAYEVGRGRNISEQTVDNFARLFNKINDKISN